MQDDASERFARQAAPARYRSAGASAGRVGQIFHREANLDVSEHHAQVAWQRGDAEFDYAAYPREHSWTFDHGINVSASAAPEYRGKAGYVDPEQAFVAALASCHMLSFLAIAARRRLVVNDYRDSAVGILEKNAQGKLALTHVDLRPQVIFDGPPPTATELTQLHEWAHQECFIANSVLTKVNVSS